MDAIIGTMILLNIGGNVLSKNWAAVIGWAAALLEWARRIKLI